MRAEVLKIFFIGVICLLSFPANTLAQTDKIESAKDTTSKFTDSGWWSLGLGRDYNGSKKIENYPAFSFSANIGTTRFWQAGINANGPLIGSKGGAIAFHVGRGISEHNRWGRVSVAGGPSLVIGEEYLDKQGEYNTFYTPGLAANAQAIFTPVMELGIGLELQGNLNVKNPMAGFRFIFVIEGVK